MPKFISSHGRRHNRSRRRRHRRRKVSTKKKLTTYKGSRTDKTQSRELVKLSRKVNILWKRPEYKWVEDNFTASISSDVSTPFGGTGSQIYQIQLPAQGTTVNTRIGDKCYLKKWTVRMGIYGTADTVGTQDTENVIRIIFAMDKIAAVTENGTSNPLDEESNFVGWSNILQNSAFTGSAGLISPLKREYDTSVNGCAFRTRWRILHDQCYTVGVDSNSYSSSAPHEIIRQVDFHLGSTKVDFDKAAKSPSSKALYIFVVSNSGATSHPGAHFYSVLSYTDS